MSMRRVSGLINVMFLFSSNITTAANPPLNWETAKTSVDIEDNSEALLCEVSFLFALDQGVVLKETKQKGCSSE